MDCFPYLRRLFGARAAAVALAPTPELDLLKNLESQIEFTQRMRANRDALLASAKRDHAAGLHKTAKLYYSQAKQAEEHYTEVMQVVTNVLGVIDMRDRARVNKDAAQAMRAVADKIDQDAKEITLDDVDTTMARLQEMTLDMQRMTTALSQEVGPRTVVDDFEMEQELYADADADASASAEEEEAIHIPPASAPSTALLFS